MNSAKTVGNVVVADFSLCQKERRIPPQAKACRRAGNSAKTEGDVIVADFSLCQKQRG